LTFIIGGTYIANWAFGPILEAMMNKKLMRALTEAEVDQVSGGAQPGVPGHGRQTAFQAAGAPAANSGRGIVTARSNPNAAGAGEGQLTQ
jgi:hypothetical protein